MIVVTFGPGALCNNPILSGRMSCSAQAKRPRKSQLYRKTKRVRSGK